MTPLRAELGRVGRSDGHPVSTIDPQRVQRATMRVLVTAQVLGSVGMAAGGAAGSLLAVGISGSASTAGLPLAALVAGAAAGAVPVTRLMGRRGRRAGLVAALLVAMVGALVVLVGAAAERLALVLAGSVLLGAGNIALTLARYAAADLTEPRRRGRSMSTVLFATTAGAVLGPNLLGPAATPVAGLGLPPAAGLFLLALIAFPAAALALAVGLRPDPLLLARALSAARTAPLVHDGPDRPGAAWASGTGRRGLLVLATANLVMVSVMAVAPVHLEAHGTGLGLIGLVVSGHVAAMFGPTPLAGAATDRFGAPAVASTALGLLAAAGLLGASITGHAPVRTGVVLLLVGLGWCAGLVAGSLLLTEGTISGPQRTRAEGLGEAAMGVAAATGALLAGPLVAHAGFGSLCLLGAVLAVASMSSMSSISSISSISSVRPTAHGTGRCSLSELRSPTGLRWGARRRRG